MRVTQGQTPSTKSSMRSPLDAPPASPPISQPSRLVEVNLFPEIIVDIIPTMPESLLPYTHDMTNERARTEGDATFLLHVRQIQDHQPYLRDDSPISCGDLNATKGSFLPEYVDEDPFFPEYADDDDFRVQGPGGRPINPREDVSANFTRNRKDAIAEIMAAVARRECSGCLVRVQCLAKSFTLPPGVNKYGENLEVAPGIWGGYFDGGRAKILRQFNILRRSYEAGRRSMEQGLSKKNHVGMSVKEIKKYEARALALTTL